MFRNTATVLVATLLVLTAAAPAAAFTHDDTHTPDIQQYATGPSYIVEFENGSVSSLQSWANSSEDRQLIRVHNGSNTATVAAPKAHLVDSLYLRVTTGQIGVDALEGRSYITDIHPNYILHNAEPVSVLANESNWQTPQVGITSIDDPDYPTEGVAFDNVSSVSTSQAGDYTGASNVSATGAGTRVAVIDTGCNVAGGSLGIQGDILNESATFLGDERTTVEEGDYTTIEDENGHGSWVTASITGNSSVDQYDGLAPDAEVLCLQALNSDGSGSTSDIAAAIRYAADANVSVDVLTMSLGSPVYSEALANAIEYAFNNSDLKAVTVATGNSRQTTTFVATPADVEGVIGVGAITGEPPGQARSAYFSQVGGQSAADTSLQGSEDVDVAAPGMKVATRVPTTAGGADNRTLSGTSMATPLAAGNLLLALEANSTLASMNHTDVEDAVTASARPVPNASVAETGQGMVAGDNLASGAAPETSQEEARTSAAKKRDLYYDALADSTGGLLAGLWGGS